MTERAARKYQPIEVETGTPMDEATPLIGGVRKYQPSEAEIRVREECRQEIIRAGARWSSWFSRQQRVYGIILAAYKKRREENTKGAASGINTGRALNF